MKRICIAVLTSLLMGFVGLFVGTFLDDFFGGASFTFTPVMSIIFVILTMGAFIIYFNDTKK